ncbi:MAG: hypothetical protein QOE28_252 [Solirubrobacteraceae bacterium]|jgi:hypothetical protein|nr:hypothetical protein [Solirubrobacteraceae bacterium]
MGPMVVAGRPPSVIAASADPTYERGRRHSRRCAGAVTAPSLVAAAGVYGVWAGWEGGGVVVRRGTTSLERLAEGVSATLWLLCRHNVPGAPRRADLSDVGPAGPAGRRGAIVWSISCAGRRFETTRFGAVNAWSVSCAQRRFQTTRFAAVVAVGFPALSAVHGAGVEPRGRDRRRRVHILPYPARAGDARRRRSRPRRRGAAPRGGDAPRVGAAAITPAGQSCVL